MPSAALGELQDGLREIDSLQRANPSPARGGGIDRPAVTRAIGRAEIVLLTSHLERYVYAVTEEIIDQLHQRSILAGDIPLLVRLEHSRAAVDELAVTSWEKREEKLRQFANGKAQLWVDAIPAVDLDTDEILRWMRSPNPESLVRAFRLWGIKNIFDSITRTSTHRSRLWLKLRELVEKRNRIAHGDQTAEATHKDLWTYRAAVRDFCERTDKQCSSAVARLTRSTRPW